MATARAQKIPMRIQKRIESTLFFSVLIFVAGDFATDVPVLLPNKPNITFYICNDIYSVAMM